MPLAYINFVQGGATDPGFGGGMPAGPGIDNSLPGHVPPMGSTLPEPPPGIWPPPDFSRPIVPIPPNTTLPITPGTIWPPPAGVDNTLPTPPAGGTPPPPSTKPPSSTFWVVAGIPGLGWRYVAVDPSLTVGYPLPPTPEPKA